jgi:hypothetical protein
MHIANYLGYLHRAEFNLAEGFRKVASGHAEEADVYHTCNTPAKQCEAHAQKLQPFVERYGEEAPAEPENLYHELFGEPRSCGLGLLRDMQDLYLMANACDISWTMVVQAAQGARDRELLETVNACERQTATPVKWLKTRMKQAAPQALLVAS